MPRSFTLGALLISLGASAQPTLNGPMAGPPDHMEITIWAQCPGGCDAFITYWPSNEPARLVRTAAQTSEAERGHAMEFRLGPLTPATEYRYTITVNGQQAAFHDTLTFRTQALWKFRTDPPPFKLALGSCTYINEPAYDRPGRPYGDTYGIFNAIADQQPDIML